MARQHWALADALRKHNRTANGPTEFTPDHLRVLADFLASQDPSFDRDVWIEYVTADLDAPQTLPEYALPRQRSGKH